MSKRVIIKKQSCEVNGKTVPIDGDTRLPDHLADAMDAKGLCVIVADGVRLDASADDHEVERETPAAKKAVKDAEGAKKKRKEAAAKIAKESPTPKPILKKKAAKK